MDVAAIEKAWANLSDVIGVGNATRLRSGESVSYVIKDNIYILLPDSNILHADGKKVCIIPKTSIELPPAEQILGKIIYLQNTFPHQNDESHEHCMKIPSSLKTIPHGQRLDDVDKVTITLTLIFLPVIIYIITS